VRLLLQRVARAQVDVGGQTVGAIGQGLLVLAGFGKADAPDLPQTKLWSTLCDKVLDLRIFPDEAGKLNLSLRDAAQSGQGGGLLLVSQFTLYADARRGRRPSYSEAAGNDEASRLYEFFCVSLASKGIRVETGRFGEIMRISCVNEGPVTILLDSKKAF